MVVGQQHVLINHEIKKCDLSLDLKVVFTICVGNEAQTDGAEYRKERLTNSVLTTLTMFELQHFQQIRHSLNVLNAFLAHVNSWKKSLLYDCSMHITTKNESVT